MVKESNIVSGHCCDSENDSSNARVNDSLAIVKTTVSFTSRDCIDYILNSIQFF